VAAGEERREQRRDDCNRTEAGCDFHFVKEPISYGAQSPAVQLKLQQVKANHTRRSVTA
jgi:hypothetical protein